MPPMISDDYLEVDPDGKEVRRVSLWKLLDPRRDPICPLDRRLEWTHTNSLDVTADGSILFSTRQTSRVGLIDTEGQLTWKYGFPDVSHQHHASALPNGNVQIFDNGMHRRGNPRSAIVDLGQTRVSGAKLVKVLTWFDNEWAYANRMLDVAALMAGMDRLP